MMNMILTARSNITVEGTATALGFFGSFRAAARTSTLCVNKDRFVPR